MQERLLFFPLDLIYLGTTVSCVQYHHHHHHLLTVNNNNNLVTYWLFLCFSYRRSLVKRKQNNMRAISTLARKKPYRTHMEPHTASRADPKRAGKESRTSSSGRQ